MRVCGWLAGVEVSHIQLIFFMYPIHFIILARIYWTENEDKIPSETI